MTDAPRHDQVQQEANSPPDAHGPREPRRLADPTVEPTVADDVGVGGGGQASDDASSATPANGATGEETSVSAEQPGEMDTGEDQGEDETLDAAAEAVAADLDVLRTERDQFLEAYQRTQADFENYRKQAYKRQEDAVQRALGGFVEGLLPVLDSCDAAVAHGAGEAVEPILTALYGALVKEGLERIDPAGEPFDPAEAEAVLHESGEGGEQVVAEVMRSGYRWRGQVLRPAMVKVTD